MSKRKGKATTKLATLAKRDLVVLAADKDTAEALKGLLTSRQHALQIRTVSFDVPIHPQHDPGCLLQSGGILATYARTHQHALVVFDREGSGQDQMNRMELEERVEEDLKTIWEDRVIVVVNDPELENWVWSPSPHVQTALGWKHETGLLEWLLDEGFLETLDQSKPSRPKEAMEAVLREVRRPRSSAIYRFLAEKVSLKGCADPAFLKLCDTLHKWFPRSPTE